MNLARYFESLSSELVALKNRVRFLIEDAHWLTDGEWKESVLRTVLRRHLPASIGVGSGFVLTHEGVSTQVDVLVYDATKPVLFRDENLVFISRDACLGIVEVKSSIRNYAHLSETLENLGRKARFLQKNVEGDKPASSPFIGLFSYAWGENEDWRLLEEYDPDVNAERVLDALVDATGAHYSRRRIVNHLALGPSHFVRFWSRHPDEVILDYNHWHAYRIRKRAFGYFVHNLVESVSMRTAAIDPRLWFPMEGKEHHALQIRELPRRGR